MSKSDKTSRYHWRPVHWREGMFLRPHHLQAADRHARDMLTASENWYHPYNFGFRSISIDRDALRDRRFRLIECEARFPDGTKLSIPADGTPDALVVPSDRYKRVEGLEIMLAVPRWRWKEGRSNVATDQNVTGPRFTVEAAEVEDENTGDNELEVEFRRLRSTLLLGDQATKTYVTMPIARLIQSETGHPMLDPGFVPPVLAMDASPHLYRPVRSLHRLISSRIDGLIAQLPGGRLYESQDPGEAERVLKLTTLNAAYAYLGSLVYTPGMTPWMVYHELCRLAGSLAVFTPDRRPGELLPYDHDALGACFGRVFEEIRRGLDAATFSAFEQQPFEGIPGGTSARPTIARLSVQFNPQWLALGRVLFLGVRGIDAELSIQESDEILSRIDMKLGGGSVGDAFEDRLHDLSLVTVSPNRPRILPPDYIYYRLEGNQTIWRDIEQSRTLVVQVNPTRITPEVYLTTPTSDEDGDPDVPEREERVRVMIVDGRRIGFTLFVI